MLTRVRLALFNVDCPTTTIFSVDIVEQFGLLPWNFQTESTLIASKYGPPVYSLGELLLMATNTRKAKIEKDFVYGFLGLVDEATRAQITVDYTQNTTIGTVYAQAVRAACRDDADVLT